MYFSNFLNKQIRVWILPTLPTSDVSKTPVSQQTNGTPSTSPPATPSTSNSPVTPSKNAPTTPITPKTPLVPTTSPSQTPHTLISTEISSKSSPTTPKASTTPLTPLTPLTPFTPVTNEEPNKQKDSEKIKPTPSTKTLQEKEQITQQTEKNVQQNLDSQSATSTIPIDEKKGEQKRTDKETITKPPLRRAASSNGVEVTSLSHSQSTESIGSASGEDDTTSVELSNDEKAKKKKRTSAMMKLISKKSFIGSDQPLSKLSNVSIGSNSDGEDSLLDFSGDYTSTNRGKRSFISESSDRSSKRSTFLNRSISIMQPIAKFDKKELLPGREIEDAIEEEVFIQPGKGEIHVLAAIKVYDILEKGEAKNHRYLTIARDYCGAFAIFIINSNSKSKR